MAQLKGSATNTMQGGEVRQTEMERLTAEGAETARRLLSTYTAPPAPSGVDYEAAYAPIIQATQQLQAPQDIPVPPAPSGLPLLAGILGGSVASAVTRNPAYQQQAVEQATSRIQGAEEIQRANVAQRNQFDSQRQLALLNIREQILSKKLEQELANQQAGAADKTAKELFIVKTALDHAASELDARNQMNRTQVQIAGQERIAKLSGLLDFLGRLPRELTTGASASGGLSPEQEANEINKLVDFTNQIDLKIQPETGFLTFGAKKPSDEEMSAFMRTAAAYLSSPSQRVRQTSLYFIQGALQDRFKDNAEAKLEFLRKNGLQVLAPTATQEVPNTTSTVTATASAQARPQAASVPPVLTGAPVDSARPFNVGSPQVAPSAPNPNNPQIAEESRRLLREQLSR